MNKPYRTLLQRVHSCIVGEPECGHMQARAVIREIAEFRAARSPKPPSLKEQALEQCNDYIDPDGIIRRALERLPN